MVIPGQPEGLLKPQSSGNQTCYGVNCSQGTSGNQSDLSKPSGTTQSGSGENSSLDLETSEISDSTQGGIGTTIPSTTAIITPGPSSNPTSQGKVTKFASFQFR